MEPARPTVWTAGRFDWAVTAASAGIVVGGWLDAWAHQHLRSTLETFVTPWHGVLYSGLFATSVVLIVGAVRGRAAGRAWREALPRGYGWSLVGAGLFAASGLADLAWHTLFGIEADVEALLSPTHLLLASSALLIESGSLRAAWLGGEELDRRWRRSLPALLSLSFTLSLLTFFTAYANPFSLPWPAGSASVLAGSGRVLLGGGDHGGVVPDGVGVALGVASILFYATLLTGGVLLAMRRWDLPSGSLTFILTFVIGASIVPQQQFRFVPVAIVGGIVWDGLRSVLRPTAARPGPIRVFAFSAPAILFALYFAALASTDRIVWSVHTWAGSVALAGVAGLLASLAVHPPFAESAGPTT